MSCNHPRKKYEVYNMFNDGGDKRRFPKQVGDKQRYFRNVRYVTCLQIEPGPKRADIALS